eukprot:TRINITY_DN608_c0_g1_i3.p1 TRINITY_DN608_c0_g1~~TRINITY_DN608_c0_g1_i3.p1  ORF type:complete len:556 (-),score=135.04 TRINITY_DN608_c0_g1_i3:83-1672(-)
MAQAKTSTKTGGFSDKSKEDDVRTSNIVAAIAVADAVRTSLGPRGMDKMISSPTGEVVISNDGATILQQMQVAHPIAKMLVELSKAQDVEAGDGTTTVTVIAGALLEACQKLLAKGIHASIISESFLKAATKAQEIVRSISQPIDLKNRESLLDNAKTSLNSKVVSQYSTILAPIAVDAVLRVIDPEKATNVDLENIKIIKKLGGTIDDTTFVDGLVFTQGANKAAGGPTRIENAKIGLIQFCLSYPKPNMDNSIVIEDYNQMDRVLKQEQTYITKMVAIIKKTGCNVLLIQKSILRDAVNDVSLQLLARQKILVVKDVERDEIEFISKTTGAIPIASIESFSNAKLGSAKLVEEESTSEGKIVKITGVPNAGKTVSILVRGSNRLVIDEAERSLHDALCVLRCLVKERFLVVGGGAPEIEMSLQLYHYAKTLTGMEPYCVRAYAEALEVIPSTLAENAGLNPIAIVTELRNKHDQGEKTVGINVKKGKVTDMLAEKVVQPLLVTTNAIKLATETVCMILKIDDILSVR